MKGTKHPQRPNMSVRIIYFAETASDGTMSVNGYLPIYFNKK